MIIFAFTKSSPFFRKTQIVLAKESNAVNLVTSLEQPA